MSVWGNRFEDRCRKIKRALKDIEDVNTILDPFKAAFDRFSVQLGIEPQEKLDGPTVQC